MDGWRYRTRWQPVDPGTTVVTGRRQVVADLHEAALLAGMTAHGLDVVPVLDELDLLENAAARRPGRRQPSRRGPALAVPADPLRPVGGGA